jgi:hypothetical protein
MIKWLWYNQKAIVITFYFARGAVAMDPSIFLMLIAVLAIIIILGMIVGIIIVMRQPEPAASTRRSASTVNTANDMDPSDSMLAETIPVASTEDMEAYLAEQQANLAAFELPDLSNSFKGTTQDNQRAGVVLHLSDSDMPLIAFSSQLFNEQNGVVTAETTYGKMELIVTQGRAGVKWDGQPIGILDYTNQRILGPEGQLLGSMERPPSPSDYYPISFFGQKAADVSTRVNALSTLRWFGNENDEQLPAFKDLGGELEDSQTLLLLAALMLEIGFMDLRS